VLGFVCGGPRADSIPRAEHIHVMSDVPYHDVCEGTKRDRASVRNSFLFPAVSFDAAQKRGVTLAQPAEVRDQLCDRDLGESRVGDVRLFVEARERGVIQTADAERPVAEHPLRVTDVAEDLADCPLFRRIARALTFLWQRKYWRGDGVSLSGQGLQDVLLWDERDVPGVERIVFALQGSTTHSEAPPIATVWPVIDYSESLQIRGSLDILRYSLALLILCGLPSGVLLWYCIHPFARHWRRVGAAGTYAILTPPLLGLSAWTFSHRERILVVDYGLDMRLLVLGGLCVLAAGVLAAKRGRVLEARVLAGLPELSPEKYPQTLLTDGIYATIRHPRYVELTLWVLAYAAVANYRASWIAFACLPPTLFVVVLLEERELRERFGSEYVAYERRVPRFLPRITASE